MESLMLPGNLATHFPHKRNKNRKDVSTSIPPVDKSADTRFVLLAGSLAHLAGSSPINPAIRILGDCRAAALLFRGRRASEGTLSGARPQWCSSGPDSHDLFPRRRFGREFPPQHPALRIGAARDYRVLRALRDGKSPHRAMSATKRRKKGDSEAGYGLAIESPQAGAGRSSNPLNISRIGSGD